MTGPLLVMGTRGRETVKHNLPTLPDPKVKPADPAPQAPADPGPASTINFRTKNIPN